MACIKELFIFLCLTCSLLLVKSEETINQNLESSRTPQQERQKGDDDELKERIISLKDSEQDNMNEVHASFGELDPLIKTSFEEDDINEMQNETNLEQNQDSDDLNQNTEATVETVKVNGTTLENGNTTAENTTSDLPTHRWPCKPFNLTTVDSSPTTVIMNNETELSKIFDNMNSSNGCALVLFHSPYCEFCVELAPLYNAIGRSYSNLAVIAVDAQEAMSMAARYGVSAIPTVFFFYSGKAVAKFNRSRKAEHFQGFIKELSSYDPIERINIIVVDLNGPMLTTLKESNDYYMIFSVSFLILFIVFRIFGSMFWRSACGMAVYFKSKLQREKID